MNINESPAAIVLGCHKLGLGIIRALGQKKVPVVAVYYNKKDMGYVSRYVTARYLSPHPDLDPNGFISFLTEKLSPQWTGSVVIPSNDATLIPVSRYKKELEKYFKVSACEWSITEKYIDKKYTYNLADQIGVPAPKTFLPKTFEEALGYSEIIGYPCLLKPSIGHLFYDKFKKKMLFLENSDQLKEAFDSVGKTDCEMMLQEYIPGDDTSGVNYNSYFFNKKPVLEFTAQKLRLSPPGTGFPRVVISKKIPELYESGRKMLEALNFEGFSCMEFKKDARNGIYKLMEINGRQNLSTPLAVKAGINFPYYTYKHLATGTLPESPTTFEEGIYWIDTDKDLIESIRSFKRERFSCKEYIKPYLSKCVFAVPAINDPLPFFKRFIDVFRMIFGMIIRHKKKSNFHDEN